MEPFTELKIGPTHIWRLEGVRWWLYLVNDPKPLRAASRFETEMLNSAKTEVEAARHG